MVPHSLPSWASWLFRLPALWSKAVSYCSSYHHNYENLIHAAFQHPFPQSSVSFCHPFLGHTHALWKTICLHHPPEAPQPPAPKGLWPREPLVSSDSAKVCSWSKINMRALPRGASLPQHAFVTTAWVRRGFVPNLRGLLRFLAIPWLCSLACMHLSASMIALHAVTGSFMISIAQSTKRISGCDTRTYFLYRGQTSAVPEAEFLQSVRSFSSLFLL